jgi:hypothetical protein
MWTRILVWTAIVSSALAQQEDSNYNKDCTTDFSSDYYGFGVRLGVYFVWSSSYFANTLLPDEISATLDTNCMFLLALLLSLFRGTIRHQLYQIDGLIVMHLSSGFLFSCLSIWGYRTLYYQQEGANAIRYFGGLGTHIRLALITAISVYGTWFWWEGARDGLLVADTEECRVVYTWLFHPWKLGSGIDIYYIIMSLGCAIYFGIMCFIAFLTFVLKVYRRGLVKRMRMGMGLQATEYVNHVVVVF